MSAACMASLFLESPKWDIAEWVLIFAAVVVYPVVLLLMRRYARREYEPAFQASGEFLWSCAIVGFLLCVAYGVYCAMDPSFGQPVETVLDAFAKTPMPFENSPSALMWNAGVGSWIVDSLTSYGLMQASKVSVPICFAIRTALCAGAFFGMANLIGLCALRAGAAQDFRFGRRDRSATTRRSPSGGATLLWRRCSPSRSWRAFSGVR